MTFPSELKVVSVANMMDYVCKYVSSGIPVSIYKESDVLYILNIQESPNLLRCIPVTIIDSGSSLVYSDVVSVHSGIYSVLDEVKSHLMKGINMSIETDPLEGRYKIRYNIVKEK